MPAGIGTRIVELVIYIPTKDAVTKPALFFQQANKFVDAHIFSANHAIYVGQAQLDLANASVGIVDQFLLQGLGINIACF